MRVTAYAARYDDIYPIEGAYFEAIAPGAFIDADFSRCVLLLDHNSALLLGRIGENLNVSTDAIGLRFSCSLPETNLADDASNLIKNGILTSCSWGFSIRADEWSSSPSGVPFRLITAVQSVYDVSLVTYPANRQARIISIK